MPRESTQESGREAALVTRRWLESTTYIELPWNSYKHEAMCTVRCLDGSVKCFDLAGFFLDDKSPIAVENKGVGQSGDQYQEYRKFLAIAYSSSALGLEEGTDWKRHFLWVTTHPFGYSTAWAQLESPETVHAAVKEFPDLLGGRDVDKEVVRAVASRIWLLVLNSKQQRLLLTADEITRVHALLSRKGDDL